MLLVTTTALKAEQPPGGDTELIGLINQYRGASHQCDGQSAVAVGPLAPVAALADVDGASGDALQRSLTQGGYLAAQVQLISITGPSSARDAMRFIERRYCQALSSPDHAEIGVANEGKRWRIVLARPLLSPNLRGSEDAGQEIVRLANLARSQPRRCGDRSFEPAPLLRWDGGLADIALAHSRDMATHQYFAHQGRDGAQVSDRATKAGYAWRSIGENLATGQGSAESAMAAWLASPHHCENIMNKTFRAMGAAYAVNPESETAIYWTQVFARPRSNGAEATGRLN